MSVKCRISSAILFGALLSSFALAQEPSRFDISGNLSFNSATLPSAPSSTQVRAFGWQTSGLTRLSRWFALTSQFSSHYASTDSIQLIGYTGPGTMRDYSILAGPRISLPGRGRVSPFVEGLVGADRASTSLVSNGTPVTGREIQIAYAFGGGTQINLSKRFGLNLEGQYFGTQHTIAFTGWEPSHLQLAAGIVFRMFGRGPQIAERRPLAVPNGNTGTQPAPEPATTPSVESEAPATTPVASVHLATPISSVSLPAQPQTMAAPNMHIASTNQMAAPQTVVPGGQVVTPAPQIAASTPSPATAAPPAVVPAAHPTPSHPVVQALAQSSRSAMTNVTAMPQALVQSEAEPPPISLGEYARRLREKKEQQDH